MSQTAQRPHEANWGPSGAGGGTSGAVRIETWSRPGKIEMIDDLVTKRQNNETTSGWFELKLKREYR